MLTLGDYCNTSGPGLYCNTPDIGLSQFKIQQSRCRTCVIASLVIGVNIGFNFLIHIELSLPMGTG
jgi:hypothetical protein